MELNFEVFGYTFASIKLVLPKTDDNIAVAVAETVIDKGVKKMSNWWLRKLSKI